MLAEASDRFVQFVAWVRMQVGAESSTERLLYEATACLASEDACEALDQAWRAFEPAWVTHNGGVSNRLRPGHARARFAMVVGALRMARGLSL